MCPATQLAGTWERLELQWELVSGVSLLVCLIYQALPATFRVSLNALLILLCGRYASVTLGQPCSTDSVDYTSPGPTGQEFITTVTRHNCKTPQFFCDLVSHLCEPTKPPGSPCGYDQECQSVRVPTPP